jgi:hypothetical protein
MSARLTSRMLVSSLVRLMSDLGGHAAILARGDETAGAMMLVCAEKGRVNSVLERVANTANGYVWVKCGPQDVEDQQELSQYIVRRRRSDQDLWVVELDVPNRERLTALLADLA